MITRLSTLFLRTLREDPADAEVPSHKLLVRAGYIRRVAPGIYSWLPLGLRAVRNIEAVVREEMDAIGGQELLFPALLPREPYNPTQSPTRANKAISQIYSCRNKPVSCAYIRKFLSFFFLFFRIVPLF